MVVIDIGGTPATALWEDTAQVLDGGTVFKLYGRQAEHRVGPGALISVGAFRNSSERRVHCYPRVGGEATFAFSLRHLRLVIEDDIYYWRYSGGAYTYMGVPAWKSPPALGVSGAVQRLLVAGEE